MFNYLFQLICLIEKIVILYNLISFIGWILILYLNIICKTNIIVIKIVQSLAIFDVIFSYLGIIRTNYLVSSLQIFSRYFIVWIPIYLGNVPITIIQILTSIWAISDSIRYLYYLNPNTKIIKWLRYNLFWVLYPLGILFEIISCYYSPLKNIIIIITLIYIKYGIDLYQHMIKQNNKKIDN